LILKAKHNWFIHPFFKFYAIWITKRHFKPVKLIGQFSEKQLPVLLIANHFSWWDGFWAMYFNLKVLKRTFHFMMLEEQLRKYWFFNYTGGFSISKKSKSIVETLNYTKGLLDDTENMVLIFPQGEIESMHKQSFKFEKGVERIIKNKEGKVQIIFLANLIDYFSSPKEGLYMYFNEYEKSDWSSESIEAGYNQFYKQCLDKQNLLKTK
jgi:1-acyl-sn-glycerol-3-phosphate acyltransferase